jgi:hypothetical protein
MSNQAATRRQRLGFFSSAWLVFLGGLTIVFSQSVMLDRGIGADPVPYVGYSVVAAIVGVLLRKVASQAAKEGKVRIF